MQRSTTERWSIRADAERNQETGERITEAATSDTDIILAEFSTVSYSSAEPQPTHASNIVRYIEAYGRLLLEIQACQY